MRSPVSSSDDNQFRQQHILIAEPNADLCAEIMQSLTQDGYVVQSAATGSAVLAILNNVRATALLLETDTAAPDLLVLDTALPDLSGLDLCRQLRQQRHTLPILMTSTKSTELDRVVGLELGADDYLIKPFGIRELVARCRSLLRRGQRSGFAPNPESVLSFQDILLYPDSCRVTCNGKELALSPKEFRLLELMMRHPRRVWSREQLLERVWGTDFVGDTKTVDVHIRWLREKLEPDPSQPRYVHTVRGFGYRMG